MEARRTDLVQSVQRCFAVLQAFEQLPPGNATLSTLAEITGLSRPTVRRMLLTLQDLGYVQAVGGSRWAMRPRILRFAHWFTRSSALVTVAEPHAQWASGQLREAVAVAQVDGLHVYVVAITNTGEQMTRAEVGLQIPLHATASGWITLAWTETLPELELIRHTKNTFTDPRAVIERSKQVRADRFVIVDQEIVDGMMEAGVPILTPHGWLLGTLTVALPSWDWSIEQIKERVVPVLSVASRRITDELAQTTLRNEKAEERS